MIIEPLSIPGLLLVTPEPKGDARGVFSEVFRADALAQAGFDTPFIQENQVSTAEALTLRGLHFQRPPAAQDKLIRVLSGAILDVAVDLRSGSPDFGRHVGVELDAERGRQLLIPAGFAHGYLTLTPETVVLYKVSTGYRPDLEGGLDWSDPDLAIDWGVEPDRIRTNARDAAWPRLKAFQAAN